MPIYRIFDIHLQDIALSDYYIIISIPAMCMHYIYIFSTNRASFRVFRRTNDDEFSEPCIYQKHPLATRRRILSELYSSNIIYVQSL